MPSTNKIRVLDHGFIELVDVMGSDKAIVDAARVSIAGENVRPVSEDRALIRYLYRHRHTTPFEMVEFKFRAKMPIFVARQWIRHRTANVNEMSGRYSELPAEWYTPETKRIVEQSKNNKQGSSYEQLHSKDEDQRSFHDEAEAAFEHYGYRLEAGMARELARINLPLSTYTEWIWKIDLHNLFHFLALRLHEHAQYEIRVYAEVMAEMVKEKCPLAWEAFEDFRLNGMFLTAQDIIEVKKYIEKGYLGDSHKTKRENDEFLVKAKKIGIMI